MSNKLKKDLLIVVVSILAVGFIAGSLFLGSVMSPLLFIVIYILAFNLILIPIFDKNYYWLHGMDDPGFKSFIPLYNASLICKPIFAIIANILVIVNIVVGILFTNVWIFESLGDRMFFIISDGLPTLFIITASLYYIVIGIGLATPIMQTRDLYLEFFRDEDEIHSGFVRFMVRSGSIIKYLEVLLLLVPIFRILPVYLSFSRAQELKNFNVQFEDFE